MDILLYYVPTKYVTRFLGGAYNYIAQRVYSACLKKDRLLKF